jgi:hypothetical protein
MRISESLLKILFLVNGAFLVWTRNVESRWFTAFLILNLILGVVLLLNDKAPSYRYPKDHPNYGRVLAMRRFEGALMIVFAVGTVLLIHA